MGAGLSFYNEERQDQSLGYRTPRQIYQEGLWIWGTIRVADRLRFPRFLSPFDKRGNARLAPHPPRRHSQHRT